MKKSELKKIIRSVLKESVDTSGIENTISTYLKLKTELEQYLSSPDVVNVLKSIKTKESELKKNFTVIEKGMKAAEVSIVKTDKFVAEITQELKYKKPTPNYTEMWDVALSKVNAATKSVLELVKDEHIADKANQTEPKLSINTINEGVIDWVKGKFMPIMKAFASLQNAANKLPRVK